MFESVLMSSVASFSWFEAHRSCLLPGTWPGASSGAWGQREAGWSYGHQAVELLSSPSLFRNRRSTASHTQPPRSRET